MNTKNVAYFSCKHRRETNQDHCFFLQYNGSPSPEGNMSILCVMDGVSNANGGEAVRVAPPAMIPALSALLGKSGILLQSDHYTREEIIFDAMRSAICAANHALQIAGGTCGTTVILLTVFDGKVYAANVGDSPAYLVEIPPLGGQATITSLFQCHNAAAEAVRSGKMTPEEARTSRKRNLLTRMVGSIDFLPGDIYTTTKWLGQQNLLILGSDGALSVLPEEQLLELASNYPMVSPETLIQMLYQKVWESPSTDNFTVIVQGVDTQ